MQETIDAGDCVRCTANINLFEVGNARVSGYTRIVDGELVDEMVMANSSIPTLPFQS
jgi:hypothetical protein